MPHFVTHLSSETASLNMPTTQTNSAQTARFLVAITLCSAWLAGCAFDAANAPAGSSPNASNQTHSQQALTDSAIDADYRAIAAQQQAIKTLNDSGKAPLRSYAMAKAQCWLDVSLHEYSRDDRSNFPKLALEQSRLITAELAATGQSASAAQTPLVNAAALLRPDLWDAAKALKSQTSFVCAQQQTACAEVELVHAGNEFNQSQWQHAKPYVQLAEDGIERAQQAARACEPPQRVVVAVAVPPPPPAIASPPPIVNLSAVVLFNFDKSSMDQTRSYSRDQLNGLIGRLASLRVNQIELVGHADQLNGTGNAAYNTQLSKDRVQAVRDYMVSKGVSATINTRYVGDSEPVEACSKAKFQSVAEQQECLVPNRRVTVVVTGTAAAK